MRRAGLLTCAAALVLPAGAAEAASPRIVYEARTADGNDTELFTIRPDGSRRRRLTHGRLNDANPSWAPNHRRIVFERYPTCIETPCGGVGEFERPLYIIRANGKGFRRLPNTIGGRAPSWSPDGRRIAFMDRAGNDWAVYSVRPDGSGRRLLARTEGDHIADPDWSPDGRRLVFNFSPNGIATIGVNGRNRRVVAHFGMDPSWAPGGRIAWEGHRRSRVGTVGEVYTARPDGSRRRRVTSRRPLTICNGGFHCERFSGDPAWSPNRKRLVFSEEASIRDPILYTIRPNGRGARRLVKGGRNPDW